MEQPKLYEEIFRRRSVRKYAEGSLPEKTLEEIRGFLSRLTVNNGENPVEIDLVPREELKSVFGVEAPHYALFYARAGEAGKIEAGYRMQLLSLYLTSIGVGSCIVGMAKPKKHLRTRAGMEWVISMAMGAPVEPLYRSASEFDRKSARDICSGEIPAQWVEAVRLAPSAVNGQPWYLIGDDTAIHLFRQNKRDLKSYFASVYLPFDMGIALTHLTLAAVRDGKGVSFDSDVPVRPVAPKGATFVGTAYLK